MNPASENINITDNETVSFYIRDLKPHQPLRVELICQDDIFKENPNIINTSMENSKNFANNFLEKLFSSLKIFALIIIIIYIIFYTLKIIKYIKLLNKAKKNFSYASKSSLYFRDLPDENTTPAEVAFLYYFDDLNAFNYNISKIISATILSLALKKAIKIKEYEENKIGIIIDTKYQKEKLKNDERCIYDLLCEVKKGISHDIILPKNIENYVSAYRTTFTKTVKTLRESIVIEYNYFSLAQTAYSSNARLFKSKVLLFPQIYFLLRFYCL